MHRQEWRPLTASGSQHLESATLVRRSRCAAGAEPRLGVWDKVGSRAFAPRSRDRNGTSEWGNHDPREISRRSRTSRLLDRRVSGRRPELHRRRWPTSCFDSTMQGPSGSWTSSSSRTEDGTVDRPGIGRPRRLGELVALEGQLVQTLGRGRCREPGSRDGSGQRRRCPRLREPLGRPVRVGDAPGGRPADRQRPDPDPGPHRRGRS